MSGAFVSLAVELLSGLGHIAVKRMFGGHGVYCDGLFIAIVLDDSLYFKADAHNRSKFERAGMRQFDYARMGKRATLGFYLAPADALESPEIARQWGREALAAALRSKKK